MVLDDQDRAAGMTIDVEDDRATGPNPQSGKGTVAMAKEPVPDVNISVLGNALVHVKEDNESANNTEMTTEQLTGLTNTVAAMLSAIQGVKKENLRGATQFFTHVTSDDAKMDAVIQYTGKKLPISQTRKHLYEKVGLNAAGAARGGKKRKPNGDSGSAAAASGGKSRKRGAGSGSAGAEPSAKKSKSKDGSNRRNTVDNIKQLTEETRIGAFYKNIVSFLIVTIVKKINVFHQSNALITDEISWGIIEELSAAVDNKAKDFDVQKNLFDVFLKIMNPDFMCKNLPQEVTDAKARPATSGRAKSKDNRDVYFGAFVSTELQQIGIITVGNICLWLMEKVRDCEEQDRTCDHLKYLANLLKLCVFRLGGNQLGRIFTETVKTAIQSKSASTRATDVDKVQQEIQAILQQVNNLMQEFATIKKIDFIRFEPYELDYHAANMIIYRKLHDSYRQIRSDSPVTYTHAMYLADKAEADGKYVAGSLGSHPAAPVAVENGADGAAVDAPVAVENGADGAAVDAPVVVENGADGAAVDAPVPVENGADGAAVDAPVAVENGADGAAVDAPMPVDNGADGAAVDNGAAEAGRVLTVPKAGAAKNSQQRPPLRRSPRRLMTEHGTTADQCQNTKDLLEQEVAKSKKAKSDGKKLLNGFGSSDEAESDDEAGSGDAAESDDEAGS